jgi:bifunctional non-homologous end joining protein LigD
MLRPPTIPEPMLSRPGPLPTGDGWVYEPKLDGFRALMRTGSAFRVRSRRGWEMTALVPELELEVPELVFDGELVCLRDDGLPHFPLVGRRMLHRDRSIPVVLFVFDLLHCDGRPLTGKPWSERRALLEQLRPQLEANPRVKMIEAFDDGAALWQAIVEQGMEGLIAKKRSSRYLPGDRGGWIKVKNRNYWRHGQELELVRRQRSRALAQHR